MKVGDKVKFLTYGEPFWGKDAWGESKKEDCYGIIKAIRPDMFRVEMYARDTNNPPQHWNTPGWCFALDSVDSYTWEQEDL